jgi:5'-deoxynucleotidase YfbR-like HD superfamily hydrolase
MKSQGNWLHIAEQASEEMDSAKLMTLVSKLCQALDGESQGNSGQHVSNERRTIQQRAHAE